MEASIELDLGQVLKALGIFFLSLTVAVVVGLSLPALLPTEECAFPVFLERQVGQGMVQATVSQVEGSYPVTDLTYKVVRLEGQDSRIVQEGNVTDLTASSQGLTYHRADPGALHLQPGDRFLMEGEGEIHLILLDGGGTPVGYTLGCEI